MNKLTPEEKLNIAFEKAYPDTAEVEFIGNIYDIFATGYQSALSMIGDNKEDAETVLRDHLRERTGYYEFGIYDVIPAMKQYAAQEVADKDALLKEAIGLIYELYYDDVIGPAGGLYSTYSDKIQIFLNKTTGSEAGNDETNT